MLETIFYIIVGLFLIGAIISLVVDAGVLLAYIYVPIIRRGQRVFFGIDEPRAGSETLIGRNAEVIGDFSSVAEEDFAEGHVFIDGERWRARSTSVASVPRAGAVVEVLARNGLILSIEPSDGDN